LSATSEGLKEKYKHKAQELVLLTRHEKEKKVITYVTSAFTNYLSSMQCKNSINNSRLSFPPTKCCPQFVESHSMQMHHLNDCWISSEIWTH